MKRTVYSMQMKNLFITHKDNGKTLIWITGAMGISVNTIKEWSAILKKGGNLEDKRGKNGKKKQFSDEDLKHYADTHINDTLKDIGNYFLVSEVAIWKRLKNMNYSYKKKRGPIAKGTRSTEMLSRSS